MFTQVRIRTLDEVGREHVYFYAAGTATDNNATLADIVETVTQRGEFVTYAAYTA